MLMWVLHTACRHSSPTRDGRHVGCISKGGSTAAAGRRLRVVGMADKGPVNKSPFDAGFNWKDMMKKAGGGQGFAGPGKDVMWEMNVTLEKAVLGGEQELKYEAKVLCDKCEGRGNLKGTAIVCSQCEGQGRYRMQKNISVNVPPGVNDGSTIRLKGMGEHGVPPGNLLIRVCAPVTTATIRRDGADLYSDASITQAELESGGSVEVTTIEGSTGALKVAAGTKAAAYLRIKGRGAPKAVGNMDERGDHYFRLVVKDE